MPEDGGIVAPDQADLPQDGLTRCRARLAALARLRDGWHDGHGRAPSPQALERASALVEARSVLADICSIFPTDEGGVLLEFVAHAWDYSIEVLPSGVLDICGVAVTGPGEMDTVGYPSANQACLEFLEMPAATTGD